MAVAGELSRAERSSSVNKFELSSDNVLFLAVNLKLETDAVCEITTQRLSFRDFEVRLRGLISGALFRRSLVNGHVKAEQASALGVSFLRAAFYSLRVNSRFFRSTTSAGRFR